MKQQQQPGKLNRGGEVKREGGGGHHQLTFAHFHAQCECVCVCKCVCLCLALPCLVWPRIATRFINVFLGCCLLLFLLFLLFLFLLLLLLSCAFFLPCGAQHALHLCGELATLPSPPPPPICLLCLCLRVRLIYSFVAITFQPPTAPLPLTHTLPSLPTTQTCLSPLSLSLL